MESDIYFCYSETLSDIQMKVKQFDLPKTIEGDTSLTSNKYDVVILDGNCFHSPNIELIRNYTQPQRSRGVKVIVDLPDCYVSQDGQEQIKFWQKCADLIVYHNPLISVPKKSSKFLLWPGFPIPIASYEFPWEKKKDKLLIQGSAHRQRQVFYRGVQRANVPTISQMHSRNSISNIPMRYRNYIESVKSTKYVFTNGYLNSRESIIVGRAFETLATGSVLLYEHGSKLSEFYDEYSDFLPVNNVADLIDKFKFLSSNPTTALEIGVNAKNRTSKLYNSNLFWTKALTILQFI